MTTVKAKASTPVEEEELPEGDLLGLKGRVCDEEFVQIFGQTAEITKQTDEHVFLQVPGDFRKFKVPTDAVEIIDWLQPASVAKPLQLNAGDKAILYSEFIDICTEPKERLGMGDRLSGDHLLLQAWITRRDLGETTGATFVAPVVLYQFVTACIEKSSEAAEIRLKVGQVLLRKFKRSGLMGLPIYSAPTDAEAHWSMLVLRKVGMIVVVTYILTA